MRWLITGGCGFIGKSLVRNLWEEGGYSIRVVDNLAVGTPQDLAEVCHFDETIGADFVWRVPHPNSSAVELIQ